MILLLAACGAEDPEEVRPDVHFNELVADNDRGLKDDAGDFDDWIEIAAPAGTDLSDWTLTNELEEDPLVMEPGTVATGGFVIVTCDADEGPLHAPWTLDPYGGDLVLTDADGVFVDAVRFPYMHTDMSWARAADGGWTYDDHPTPGEDNGL